MTQFLLILLNGGRMSRNYLLGIGRAARRIGIEFVYVELDQVRAAMAIDRAAAIGQLDAILTRHRVGAVLSYVFNGYDLPGEICNGVFRTFFELRGIPHLMYWIDHPQWAMDKHALRPEVQAAFRSANCHHFVKTQAHAYELSRILGWPNCHAMPMAACPEALQPATGIEPEFDVVAIYGGTARPDPWFTPFLEQDDPDPRAIERAAARGVRGELNALWNTTVPDNLRLEVQAFGQRLMDHRLADPLTATSRHLPGLTDEFPKAAAWLTANHLSYFKMTEILYRFRAWVRPFLPAYLARHFKLAVLGGDWSAVGCLRASTGPGSGTWVDLADMPAALARGKVVLNLSAAYDEEGITGKPFEIAASGCCMVHNDCRGLSDHFEIGSEVGVFNTAKEARDLIADLLGDEARRRSMAAAARARVEEDGNWADRLPRLLTLAGLDPASFRSDATPASIVSQAA